MQTVNLVQTADKYTDACTLIEPQADQIGYAVANQPVFMQTLPQGKAVLQEDWSPEFYRPPETNTLLRCGGVRFRSAIAGKPAVIVVQSIAPADSAPGPGVPFTGTLSASGSVTPGASSVQVQKDGVLIGQEVIVDFETGASPQYVASDDAANTRIKFGLPRILTGSVAGNGTISGGTGFTVVRNQAGVYTITFTTAFGAPPCVIANAWNQSQFVVNINNPPAVGSFQVVITQAATGALADCPFGFMVLPLA